MNCKDCAYPERYAYGLNHNPARSFPVVEHNNYGATLSACPTCGQLWYTFPYEPWSAYPHSVAWRWPARLWKQYDVLTKEGKNPVFSWHVAELFRYFDSLSAEEQKRIKTHESFLSGAISREDASHQLELLIHTHYSNTAQPVQDPPAPAPLPRAAAPGLAQDLFASLLSNSGRTTEAIAQRQSALKKLEEILGPHHPELQSSLDQLADDMLQLESYAAATPILQRTYDYHVAQLGPEHPDTLDRLVLLTECLLKTRSSAAALPFLERQLTITQRLKGTEHDDTLTALLLLANAYQEQGDHPSAAKLLHRAHPVFERKLGPNHPKSLVSLHALFENLSKSPDPIAAEPWGNKLISVSQQVHGPSDPLTISTVALVANYHVRRETTSMGIEVVRQALAALPKSLLPDTLAHARLQSLLAALLDVAGNIDEARSLAQTAAYVLHRHLGPHHPDTERVTQHCIDLATRCNLRTPWGRFKLRGLYLLARLLHSKRERHPTKQAPPPEAATTAPQAPDP